MHHKFKSGSRMPSVNNFFSIEQFDKIGKLSTNWTLLLYRF